MKKERLLLISLVLMSAQVVMADDPVPTPEPTPWYENEPSYSDNTGALGTGDNAADINNANDESIAGTEKGEITLREIPSGMEVFSGNNKVESIVTDSDGWVGTIEKSGLSVKFKPSGRPQLDCPPQSLSGWFGPCKVIENNS